LYISWIMVLMNLLIVHFLYKFDSKDFRIKNRENNGLNVELYLY
jgi:hypothetical protein